jgi:crossover junction endodeoxyribonuclease RuvC
MEAEKRLWQVLRNGQAGAKFRRQQPIEGYVVDFVCFERRLIVELDGGQHADADEYEVRRATCLEANGFTILRFWNTELVESLEGVFDRIAEEVRRMAPAPSPSHACGMGPSLSREGRGERTA